MTRPFVELRELNPGDRFLFASEDLPNRGPCTLIEKGPGSATIEYSPHHETRRFKARDKNGQVIYREFTETLSGRSRCALGAQVLKL